MIAGDIRFPVRFPMSRKTQPKTASAPIYTLVTLLAPWDFRADIYGKYAETAARRVVSKSTVGRVTNGSIRWNADISRIPRPVR